MGLPPRTSTPSISVIRIGLKDLFFNFYSWRRHLIWVRTLVAISDGNYNFLMNNLANLSVEKKNLLLKLYVALFAALNLAIFYFIFFKVSP